MNLSTCLEQLAAFQCNLPSVLSQLVNQWLTETVTIINGTFNFDPVIGVFKVICVLDMNTKSGAGEGISIIDFTGYAEVRRPAVL